MFHPAALVVFVLICAALGVLWRLLVFQVAEPARGALTALLFIVALLALLPVFGVHVWPPVLH
jgi:hypothetical protein